MNRRLQLLALLAMAVLQKPSLAAAQDLVITELNYDEPGSDQSEWVEIHSTLDVPQLLNGFALVFYDAAINGTCGEYCRVDLSAIGWIVENATFLVGNHPCAALPLCSTTDAIQNGSPDAITIEYLGEVIFAVEYGASSSISACTQIDPEWRTSAVDVDTRSGSLQRCRHGWIFSVVSTPCQGGLFQCSTTDAAPPPRQTAWAMVKSTYR